MDLSIVIIEHGTYIHRIIEMPGGEYMVGKGRKMGAKPGGSLQGEKLK